ncbi:hypothetical protein EJB05_32707 [Eragrostis curvula]|uniref:Uncharacterized protein n=1 Tax=Eragrostis curvula TaxID=38414 RepID=A0A5J9UH58_9POAL|nr:hypothetical protein EJB05_32707 [Eragrostis curvula]
MERPAATRTRALEAVAEPGDRPVEHQCNHFSIRLAESFIPLNIYCYLLFTRAHVDTGVHLNMHGIMLLHLRRRIQNFTLCPRIFGKKQQQDEHHNLCPISVPKFRRWNCSGCLDKVKVGDRTISIAVSTKRDSNNDGCSISFVRSVRPTSVGYTRLFPCTQRSSQGHEAGGSDFPKSTQECNSKCNSPSGSKGALTEMDVDPATKESQEAPNNLDAVENISNDASVDVSVLPDVPQMISSTTGNGAKELQEPVINLDVMENISNGASVDISGLPDIAQMISTTAGNGTKELQESPGNLDVVTNISNGILVGDTLEAPQMLSSKSENGTHNLSSLKSYEVPNEDENERVDDVLIGDSSAPNVAKPAEPNAKPAEPKGSEPISGHNGSQVRNRGSRQAASKRNAGSGSKKKNNVSTNLSGISDPKFCQRKRKRTRLLSELIETHQMGGPTNSIDVDHARVDELCESDTGKMSLEVDRDNDTSVSKQKAEETESRTVQNSTMLRVDDVHDQSSLMNWLKRSHKKVRTERKESGDGNVDSFVVSNSTPGISSDNLHQDSLPSAGNWSQEKAPSTTNAKHGNGNMQNHSQGPNMLKENALCQEDEPGNSKQMFLSMGESEILVKRKVPSTVNAKHGGAKSGSIIAKKKMRREDHKGHTASENTQRRCLSKVSLGKRGSHNVSGTHDQKMAMDKKKQKLQVLEKQAEIDDIPMDVVELLARHQRERQLMTDADSLETSHTRPTAEDCAQMAANKDGSIDASTVLDTNFLESLTSQRKQKLSVHASSSTKAANLHPLEEPYAQMSVQGHAVSNTQASDRQMQNSLLAHAASITEAVHVYPPKLRIPDILMCTEEQQTHSHMDKEVTIACASPTFSHHGIAEVPTRSLGTNRTKKLMWDSFKTGSRNSLASSYCAPFRSGFQEVGSTSPRVFGASNNYPTYPPATVEHYTKKAVNQAPLRNQAMEAGRLYDQRIAGQPGLYPRETMPASHLLRLMDSSTASGFTNRNRMAFEASASQYVQNQYKASPSILYGAEKFPLTTEDFSRHQVQQNLHRPLRPHPRVGVLGSLLQQEIANLPEHRGTHTGYRVGMYNGIAPIDSNRKENCEALNSGILSARWNALQSAANPEYLSPRYSEAQSWSRGTGKVVHPLDKLVRQDICQTNRNPADFTTISDKNEYMISL